MFTKKPTVIIAITTYNIDALRISVPSIRRCARGATLIIHNDNPNIELTRKFVKRLGWHGKVHIIQSKINTGEFESRIAILEYIIEKKIISDWIVFVDDDDALIDATVPPVSESTFAIIQNATTISENITDIFKITPQWVNGSDCGTTGAHFDITGTLIKYDTAKKFVTFMRSMLPAILQMSRHFKYRVPAGAIMWIGLKTLMQITEPKMSVIYMNKTNYVSIKIGRPTQKYGLRSAPTNYAKTFNLNTTKKYAQMFEQALSVNEFGISTYVS